jgi:hypothetical protein
MNAESCISGMHGRVNCNTAKSTVRCISSLSVQSKREYSDTPKPLQTVLLTQILHHGELQIYRSKSRAATSTLPPHEQKQASIQSPGT